jgi:hypothetical protein
MFRLYRECILLFQELRLLLVILPAGVDPNTPVTETFAEMKVGADARQ